MTNQLVDQIEEQHEAGESIRVLLCRPDDINTIPPQLRRHVKARLSTDVRRRCDGCDHTIWMSELALSIYHNLIGQWRRGFIIRPRRFCPRCFQEIRDRLPDESFTAVPVSV